MKPIIALDFSSKEEVLSFLDQFNEPLFVKVGMELYYQEGPEIVKLIKSKGHQIFLDLKLHDIPNTVYKAMKGLAKLQVDMTNVHAAGGSEMMKAALKGLADGNDGKRVTQLIAVTQLTSISQEVMQLEQGITSSLEESVLRYAKLAYESGLDGVVCSALEANLIKDATSIQFIRVTPGIRLVENSKDDQVRIATPDNAKSLGSSQMVVGRAITAAQDPQKAYTLIKKMWEESNA